MLKLRIGCNLGMLLKHENGPKAESLQVPRKKTKTSHESHTISAKFFAGYIASSLSKVSAFAQSWAGVEQGEIFTSAGLERDAEVDLA